MCSMFPYSNGEKLFGQRSKAEPRPPAAGSRLRSGLSNLIPQPKPHFSRRSAAKPDGPVAACSRFIGAGSPVFAIHLSPLLGRIIGSFGPLLWPGDGRLPIQVPVAFPEVFELHQFRVAVSEPHVDRTGHLVAGRKVARSTGCTTAAMPRNRAASHLVGRHTEWLAGVRLV